MLAAARLLERVGELGAARSAELADELGLNRSTCHDILKTLVFEGLLSFDGASKTYRPGPVLEATGARAWEASGRLRALRPALERWVWETGCMAYLARLLPNREFVVVDRVEAVQPIRITIDVGQRFPLVVAAKGKAYLSQLPEAVARALLVEHGLPRYAPDSITDVDEYLAELAAVRSRGWASSRREYYGGAGAIAAPVRGPGGEVELVVCSMGTEDQLPEPRLEELGPRLAGLARELEAALRQ